MKKFILPLIAYCLLPTLSNSQPSSWSSRGVGGGGALFSPSFNPANLNELYVACDMSELFQSTNGGTSYNLVHFNQVQGGHNSKVQFTNGATRYCISYDNNEVVPVKSTDAGVTWTTLTGNPDNTQETFTIHADYNNPNRVIISYYGEIYISNNGGTTFTLFHTATNTGAGNVVGGVFFDGNNIYVGTNDGVLVSTNGGTNWSTAVINGLPSTERIFSFAAAKMGNKVRFYCLTADVGDIYVGVVGSDYYGFMAGVYSASYGTGGWVPRMTGITANDYPMYVEMAENDTNICYLAGSNTASEPVIFKTTTAGGSWTKVFNTASNQNINTGWCGQGGDRGWSYAECPFGFEVAANNASYVMFSDFGFIHKTTNGGNSWQQIYLDAADQNAANANTPTGKYYHSSGLENTTCWQVHWMSATNMWACFSDIRGVRSIDGGQSWSFNYTGTTANSSYRIAQGGNGTLYAGTSNIHDMYQSTRLQDAQLDATDANGRIIYSTTNGASWQQLHLFNHPVFWIALDPNNPNRAYASVIHYNAGAGVGGVYRCNDLNNLATSTWTLLPDPPNTEKHPASLVVLNDGKLVATYSGRRNSGGTFTASSGCFIYDPNTNAWTNVTHTGMRYWTKDIVVDPNDAQQNTWYVSVFSGWGGAPNGLGGLYKTTNRGTTWTKLTGSTLDRVTSCTFNPANANQMFITTEYQGMWMSSNINAGTPTFSAVNSYPFRQPERIFFNPNNSNEMWVTSFGNGMKMGLMSGTGAPEFSKQEALNVYPNPAKEKLTVRLENAQEVILYNAVGEQIASWKMPAGESDINTSQFPNGIYYIRSAEKAAKVVIAQ